MYKNADLTLAVTEDEARFIKEFSNKVRIIPNGIDIAGFKFKEPIGKQGSNILFVGNFTYFPNIEAINSFYDNVFKFLPENIKLTVVGKKVGEQKFAKDSRAKAIEFVPDIKEAYSTADVLISPVTVGGGTNFKVLEAMASGVPVIAFGERANALGAQDEKHLLIAQSNEDFIKKIELLLSDSNLRQKLAKNARALVEEKYSWENIGKDLARAWGSL